MWQRTHTDKGLFEQATLDAESLSRAADRIACPDGRVRQVLSVGSGPTLVFVPIVDHVNFVWAPQIERFSRDRHVVLFEPLVSREHNLSLRDRAAEIATVLDALGVETADIVAWSDGGSAAYVFAATWPKRCRSIAFIGLADRFAFPFPIGGAMRLFRRYHVERFVPEWSGRKKLVFDNQHAEPDVYTRT
jgi:pimeloyl-ACP methyl ester carboxylesterase